MRDVWCGNETDAGFSNVCGDYRRFQVRGGIPPAGILLAKLQMSMQRYCKFRLPGRTSSNALSSYQSLHI
ncbi:MAG: hypothetical protein ACFFDI_11040 [Promethearchaeota archaeon]